MQPLLIKKIQTRQNQYIYDTWSNEILKTDSLTFSCLPDNYPEITASAAPDRYDKTAAEFIKAAQDAGYFSETAPTVSVFGNLSRNEIKALIESGPRHLILNITEQCNLRCKYCSFSGAYHHHRSHSQKVMSKEVLETAIDFYLKYPNSTRSIGFYGGEPLLEFGLLRHAVEIAKKQTDSEIRFRVTTNGTFLKPEICRFLIDNDFGVNISLDGPQSVHDRYRICANGKGSFAQVWKGIQTLWNLDKEYFKKRVSFNLVAAPPLELIAIHEFIESYPELFCGRQISVSAVNPYPSSLPGEIKLDNSLEAQYQKDSMFELFAGQLLENTFCESFPAAIYKNDFLDIHCRSMDRMPPVTSPQGQCIPGYSKCFVSTEGSLYMCERVGNCRPIGSIWEGLDVQAIIAFLDEFNRFTADSCSRCWAIRLCNRCYVHLHYGDEFNNEIFKDFCQASKRRWHWVLTKYCEIREKKSDAFSVLV